MTIPIRILIITGFCAASLGAAGLGKHAGEGSLSSGTALAILGCGVLALIMGGILLKLAKKTPGETEAEDAGSKSAFTGLLEEIRREIHGLDDSRNDLSAEELTERIDTLLKEQYFDLTTRHEELAALLGFSKYAGIWDGVASAERLISRAWSMATDGHLDEAIEELPRARAQIDRACAAIAGLGTAADHPGETGKKEPGAER